MVIQLRWSLYKVEETWSQKECSSFRWNSKFQVIVFMKGFALIGLMYGTSTHWGHIAPMWKKDWKTQHRLPQQQWTKHLKS